MKGLYKPEEAWVRRIGRQVLCAKTRGALFARCTHEAPQDDVDFFKDLEREIRVELEKLGPIETLALFHVCSGSLWAYGLTWRLIVAQYNPEGVVAVKFKTHEAAALCVEVRHRELSCNACASAHLTKYRKCTGGTSGASASQPSSMMGARTSIEKRARR